MKNKIISFLLVMALLFGLGMPAYAMPDEGTVTIIVKYKGRPVDSGELTLYRVGTIVEEDGKYSFAPVRKLKNSGISLKHVNDPELAEELAWLAYREDLEAISAPIADGEAFFDGVDAGLYVVVQTRTAVGFEPMSPYLLSMPQYEEGEWIADVVARPKVPLEPDDPDDPDQPTPPDPPIPPDPPTPPDRPTPPEPPVTPDDPPETPDTPDTPDNPPVTPEQPGKPTLPATGQLNWPVPLMAACGLALFLIGWVLFFRGKKSRYEK